ncbi:MAG: thioredoxin [Muribaculaceae bacterium]|nr:thioredoxin [Muribaculaceae bacterium]MDE5924695.1 thioredoxin [Muribaculaceae bacterium]MDE6329591.1 thioredoxin [Muribaculaceae bacterium]
MNKFEELVNEKVPVLVDFYATWCGPCQMMHPILEDIHSRMGDSVKILKIDIDKNEALSTAMKVRSVPTLMIFKDGELKWRESGVHSASDLEAKLKEFI